MLTLPFRPAIAVMNRMNFALKFVVIGVVLLLPFAYVTHLMSKGSDKQIVFNQKEAYGVDYITPAFQFLGHLQDCRTYSAAVLAGDPSFARSLEREQAELEHLIPRLDAVDAAHRDDFRTEDGSDACGRRWLEIKQGWGRIRSREFRTQDESFAAYTELCSLVTDWILNYAANYSNLILDPDLDSYWLMDAFVGKMPQITEDLSQACARSIGLLSSIKPGQGLTMDERLALHGLCSDAANALDGLDKVNFKTAYDYNNTKSRTLQARLDRLLHTAEDRSREFLDTMKFEVVRPDAVSIKPADLVGREQAAVDSMSALYDGVGPELRSLITARVVSYRRDKTMGMIASELATFLHVYLFIAFYLAIHASVTKVSKFTQRMLAGTEEHFELDSRDELARVAESYNRINEALIQTRALKSQVERRTGELAASENRFRSLASRAPVGIFMLDAEGACTYVNDRWCEMAQLGSDEAKGKGWLGAIHPADRDRVLREWTLAAATRSGFQSEYRFGSPDGRVTWLAGTAIALTDAGTFSGFLGSVTDITEHKRVEKLKNEFISTVSHELRTPLTSIRGSLGLIAGGVAGSLTPKAKGMIDIAQKNCERLVRLVNDILDIEKIESGRMTFAIRPLDLAAMIDQAVEANRSYAQGFGVSIRVENPLPRAQVLADSDRLAQVLTNLMSNAAKFSPKDESIVVSVSRAGTNLRVAVSDRGPGIPEEFQGRIFQKFAQADGSDGRAKQGTGLGLSICKAIVERMGGRIGFATGKGSGTTFFFELPEEKPVLPAQGARDPGRPTVLVCEDDADISAILLATLDNLGYNADLASSAAQAKELLARGRYDGMTLDLAMPGQDGISLVRELRENPATRQMPIIVVSAYIEEGRRSINGEAFGIVDWLEKPIDEDRLRRSLARATDRIHGRRARILHVEDDRDIHDVVKAALAGSAEVVQAASVREARGLIGGEKFDLMILDIGLPDGSGLELLPVIRGSSQASIPVLIFSAQEVSPKTARHVAASLTKSKTSNEELIGTIQNLLGSRASARAPEPVAQVL